jgi:hypothetical protein
VRSRSSAVLLALAIVACARPNAAAKPSGYVPKWRVGDWWVIKTCSESQSAADLGTEPHWVWDETRYEVTGEERMNKHKCFVLTEILQGAPGPDPYNVYYVRKDTWLIVRRVEHLWTGRGLRPPLTFDLPHGVYGAVPGREPRMPKFPLSLNSPDTAFRLKVFDDRAGILREVSALADSDLVNRVLSEGDSADGRVVRPAGIVYEVRSERAGNRVLTPKGDSSYDRISQSLQFWSESLPWRLYECYFTYDPQHHTQSVPQRSWLIAVGHKEK